MQSHWFCKKFCGNPPVGERNCEIHKHNLIGALAELPGESHAIDEGLEVFPVLCVDRRVWVFNPYSETVIDETFEEGQDGKGEGLYVGLLVDGYKEVRDGGCRRHPHCDTFVLMNKDVAKRHSVVVHDNIECFDEWYRGKVWEVG